LRSGKGVRLTGAGQLLALIKRRDRSPVDLAALDVRLRRLARLQPGGGPGPPRHLPLPRRRRRAVEPRRPLRGAPPPRGAHGLGPRLGEGAATAWTQRLRAGAVAAPSPW